MPTWSLLPKSFNPALTSKELLKSYFYPILVHTFSSDNDQTMFDQFFFFVKQIVILECWLPNQTLPIALDTLLSNQYSETIAFIISLQHFWDLKQWSNSSNSIKTIICFRISTRTIKSDEVRQVNAWKNLGK